MARPFQHKSLDAVSAPGAGSNHHTKGHNTIGIFVVARNLDAGNDTLSIHLEAGLEDAETWAPIHGKAGAREGTLTESEFTDEDGDGTYTAFLYMHAVPTPRIRAHLTELSDAAGGDLEVDAYVLGTNRAGTGKDFQPPV